jgi:iron(III) transport system substrate-binding protein
MMNTERLTRLTAIAASLIIVAACSGTPAASSEAPAASAPAASSDASAPPASETGLKGTWDEIVAAAAEEGTLNLWVHSGAGYEDFVAAAQEALPELDIQFVSAGAGSQAPLIAQEQQGGVYTWDIVMAGNSGVAATLNPAGATIPIRPFFDALPEELKNDEDWVGGFHVYANDDELNWVIQYQINGGLWINRDLAPDLDDADDLLDPALKGLIVIHDPTTVSTGSGSLANVLAVKGEDYLRTILQTQEPIITEGPEGVHEALADGRAAVGIGGNSSEHLALQEDGLGLNVEEVKDPTFMYPNVYGMSVFKNLPHPNATAVFMNWALSLEGMQAWSELSRVDASSRRVGTTGGGIVLAPDELEQFLFIGGTYSGQDLQSKVFEIATE